MREQSPTHRGDLDPTADYVLAQDTESMREEAQARLLRIVIPPDWHELAECRGAPTALFFPERGGSTKEAHAMCQRCQVADACLADALATPAGEDHGIRAGTSGRQRMRMRAERARGAT